MLKIYTGDCSESLNTITEKPTYKFPENGKSGWEQIEWLTKLVEQGEYKKKDIIITTFSPYLLNLLNLLLIRKDLVVIDLKVEYLFKPDEDKLEVSSDDLIINQENEGTLIQLVDTRNVSDPISAIYQEFNEINEARMSKEADTKVEDIDEEDLTETEKQQRIIQFIPKK